MEELKKHRCPECGFEIEVTTPYYLWCFSTPRETITTGPICPRCIINAMKEKFPTMEVVEKGKDDNEL